MISGTFREPYEDEQFSNRHHPSKKIYFAPHVSIPCTTIRVDLKALFGLRVEPGGGWSFALSALHEI